MSQLTGLQVSSGYYDGPHPDAGDIGGPWMEVKFTSLDSEVKAQHSEVKVGYSMGVSQVRIASASIPRSSVLSFAPHNSEQDTIKVKRESTRSAGLRTLGLIPSAQLEGTLGSTLGEERSQNKWQVAVRSLTFDDKNGTSTNNQTTTMWRYMSNDAFYPQSPMNDLEPKPCTIFGLNINTRLPVIEVNVLMQYFRSNGSQSFRDWFTQSTQPKDLPVYRNFIHEASATIDLGLVEEEDQNEWTRELTSTDWQDLRGPGEKKSRFPPHVEKLSNYTAVGVSTAEVSMARVFLGHVAPRARTSEF